MGHPVCGGFGQHWEQLVEGFAEVAYEGYVYFDVFVDLAGVDLDVDFLWRWGRSGRGCR